MSAAAAASEKENTVPPTTIEAALPEPEKATTTANEETLTASDEESTSDGIALNNLTTKLQLISANLSFFAAGFNDGSLGTLVPYIRSQYGLDTGLVSVIYLATFAGWILSAATNTHLFAKLGMGGMLITGAILQLIANALRVWTPPYALYCVSFFFSGLGIAYQDSYANTFVSSLQNAHRWLGFMHALYGLGCLISPLVAASMARALPGHWTYFYSTAVFLQVVNLVGVIIVFRNFTLKNRGRDNPTKNIKAALSTRTAWTMSLFFFFYLGVSMTAGGWIVEFLIMNRHGKLSQGVGYVPTGYYGGLTLGRIILPEPTYRFGERRMIMVYTIIVLVLQLIIWFVPNLIADAVVICIFGMLIGPFFPTGMSLSTKLLPPELHITAMGLIFVMGQAGGALFPTVLGVAANKAGVGVLQPILVALICAMGGAWLAVPPLDKRRD